MANEAQITGSLRVRVGTQIWKSPDPQQFNANVSASKGPVPGGILIPAGGRILSISELGTPGVYWIKNNSTTTKISYGIYDSDSNRLFLWGDVLPGERFPGRFNSDLRSEFVGTGTGTVPSSGVPYIHATEDVWIEIYAFPK